METYKVSAEIEALFDKGAELSLLADAYARCNNEAKAIESIQIGRKLNKKAWLEAAEELDLDLFNNRYSYIHTLGTIVGVKKNMYKLLLEAHRDEEADSNV